MWRREILLLSLITLLWASGANAACTGSGTTWNCTADSTAANIQSAINSSSDGAIITVANGSYSWTSGINFSGTKATTLICATVGGCTVTGSGIIGENATCSGNSTKLQRVSGFRFSGDNNPRLWWAANSAGIPCTRNVRIDHNTFTGTATGGTIMLFGHFTATDNYIYGVIDHNTVTATSAFYFLNALNGDNNPPTGSQGGPNNLFVEDNTITSTVMDGAGGPVCVDAWGGAAIVVRYNTFTNCRVSVHGVTHAWGPRNLEVYNNTSTFTSGAGVFGDGYRAIHHQGSGTFMVFNNTVNTFSGKSGSAIALLHYRSWTTGYNGIARCTGSVSIDGNRQPTNPNFGYPCFRQPGRDPARNLFPVYIFNNKFGDGTRIDLVCEDQGESNPNTCVNHVVNNRDYFNAVGNAQTSPTSPFNGISGMGFGTLANRPTTCTTNPLPLAGGALTGEGETGGGVGYFATDQGAQGTLYRCSATNTWTVHYTPYAYPHPLTSGLVGSAPLPGPDPGPIVFKQMYGSDPSDAQLANFHEFQQAQFNYATQIGVGDPLLAVYEAFGLAFSQGPTFQSQFGPGAIQNDSAFAMAAWQNIFKTAPSAGLIQFVTNQIDYHATIYAASGAFGSDPNYIRTLARGATYGILIGMAEESGQK